MSQDSYSSTRRQGLRAIGLSTVLLTALSSGRIATAASARESGASDSASAIPGGATTLQDLARRLAQAPRRRQFESVPFMLTDQHMWDKEAADALLGYQYPFRQMWDVAELSGPWPGLMREAMNAQVFANGRRDFLAVSATHGLAHLALFPQSMWDKYDLAKLAGPKFNRNTLIVEKDGVSPADALQDLGGFYGPQNNNVTSLQRRGAVFVACHDSIHAISRTLAQSSASSRSANDIAADLTNNLIPGAVLVPSVVGFMVDLQKKGFTFA
jgi:intracellular sulfur oxidation DsrE/DsrF family protein